MITSNCIQMQIIQYKQSNNKIIIPKTIQQIGLEDKDFTVKQWLQRYRLDRDWRISIAMSVED